MLNVQRLQLLVELADRGTIRAVADAVHYTPSTVSEALVGLEREVGVALLERGPRSVRLTPAGEALAEHGRDIVARLSAARSEARAVSDAGRNHISIATFPSAGPTIVADALARLSAHHSDLRIDVVEAEPGEALQRLRAGDVDLALVYEYGSNPAPTPQDIVLELLREEPIMVCLPPSIDLHGASAIGLADLRDRPFVAGRRGSLCHAFTTAACRAAGFEPEIAYQTDDIALTSALINADLGVAIMARSLVDTSPVPVRTADAAPELPPRRVLVARRSDSIGHAPLSAAVDALATVCQS